MWSDGIRSRYLTTWSAPVRTAGKAAETVVFALSIRTLIVRVFVCPRYRMVPLERVGLHTEKGADADQTKGHRHSGTARRQRSVSDAWRPPTKPVHERIFVIQTRQVLKPRPLFCFVFIITLRTRRQNTHLTYVFKNIPTFVFRYPFFAVKSVHLKLRNVKMYLFCKYI